MQASPVPAAAVLCPAMLLLITLLAIVPITAAAAAAAAVALNATTPCSPASCGVLNITYPFWLAGTHPPECGYKAFEVDCDEGNVSLKNTFWTYKIVDIFYANSSFRVLNVNLSDGTCDNELNVNASSDLALAPYKISSQNQELFFLYDCQRQAGPLPRSWAPVSCADDSTDTFAWFAGKYKPDGVLTPLPGNCTVSVMPVTGYEGATGADYRRLMEGGFLLEYPFTAEDCDPCKVTGGRCRVNSTDDVLLCDCSDGSSQLFCGDPDLIYG